MSEYRVAIIGDTNKITPDQIFQEKGTALIGGKEFDGSMGELFESLGGCKFVEPFTPSKSGYAPIEKPRKKSTNKTRLKNKLERQRRKRGRI